MTNEDVLQYSKYIYSIMKRFQNYANKEDLYQAGYIGLINAFNHYDDSYGAKFTTYAYPYILGEMYKLVTEDKNLKISGNIYKLSRQIEKATNILAQKLKRYPTTLELANFLELDEIEINECLKLMNPVLSTDALINNDENNLTIIDTISSPNLDLDTLLCMKDALNNLSEQERFILEHNIHNYTQEEIANMLGINQVKVSRELTKIKQKVKSYMT